MVHYPEILLPCQTYPILKNDDVKDNALVRETMVDAYKFLAKPEYEPDDILPLVVAPQPSLREVFELSTFLYGYYEDQHIGIRVNDTALYADWKKELPELTAGDILFFQEKAYPLYLANRIPREKSNTHTKYLAKSILEYIISEAILLKTSVNIFRRSDFD